ncbi:MAG: hypothetical protein ABGZ35_23335, partial [Planctomycetaceae bacterium]
MAVLVSLIAMALTQYRALLDVAIRPISWFWLCNVADLLPKMTSILHHPEHWIAASLVTVCAASVIWRQLEMQPASVMQPILSVALLAIGLACSYYLWPAAFAAVSISDQWRDRSPDRSVKDRTGWRIVAGLSCCLILFNSRTTYQELMGGSTNPDIVDVTRWNTRGNVALMNLDHAARWNSKEIAALFQLVLNDRWDVFGDSYASYSQFCLDLRHGRASSYLRPDGTWGGSRQGIRKWSPTLLAVDSKDISTIRSIAISPYWSLMGIDSSETVFGSKSETRNRPQQRQALECIMSLEWPSPGSTRTIENTVVAKGETSSNVVADVLCAARFPYAGLRFISGDAGDDGDNIRMWCYLALASRVHRHSGATSLLDQGRAATLVRRLLSRHMLSSEERGQIARTVAALGLGDLAHALDPRFANRNESRGHLRTNREASQDLAFPQSRQPESPTPSFSADETAVRQAIAGGDHSRATALLSELEGSVK